MLTQRKINKFFIHKNVRYLLKTHHLDNQSLSKYTGIPVATISRLRQEGCNPTISSLEPIAHHFKVDLADLLYEDMSAPAYQERIKLGQVACVPIVSIEESLKWPHFGAIEDYIGVVGIDPATTFGIKLQSESAYPIFNKNSIILVSTTFKPYDSAYVLVVLDKDIIPVLRQVFIEGSCYFFKPINPAFGEMKHYEHYEIVGGVIKNIEDFLNHEDR